nr:GGDEF domain-containing protein [Kineococcus siccus]
MAAAGLGALVLAAWALLTRPGAPAWLRAGYSAFAAPVIVAGTAAAEHGSSLEVGSIALVAPVLVVALARSRRETVLQLLFAELVYGTYLAWTLPWRSAVVGVVVSAAVLGVVAVFTGWLRLVLDDALRELESSAHRDPLTGLLNRRGLAAALARGDARPCALLLADLDHFKEVNDVFGHAVGDRTLQWVATVLRDPALAEQLVARIGGEEFVVVVPGAVDAAAVAERLRRRTATPSAQRPVVLTVSVGVARGTSDDLPGLLSRADLALYRAKRAGRDRVVVADA